MKRSEASKDGEGWRLGPEGEHPIDTTQAAPSDTAPGPPSGAAGLRLEATVLVLTGERVGWVCVALVSVATRLAVLSARPLDPVEAGHALLQLMFARHGAAAAAEVRGYSLWFDLVEGGLLRLLGAGDGVARLLPALSGLLLVGLFFALRGRLGRAGALVGGWLVALSPTLAWLSRSDLPAIPGLALALAALIFYLALQRRPAVGPALGFGLAAGLGCSADASMVVVATSLALALAAVALWRLVAGPQRRLSARLWFRRRAPAMLLGAVVAAVLWWTAESGFGARAALDSLQPYLELPRRAVLSPDFAGGLSFYLPLLLGYEFMTVVMALVGAAALLAGGGTGLFGPWCVAWAAAMLGLGTGVARHSPQLAGAMVVSMALLAGVGAQRLYELRAWRLLRYLLLALGLLTLYVQAMTGWLYATPDGAGGQTQRHGVLFWRQPATTRQTREQCALASRSAAQAPGTVFFADDSRTLRWYLRKLRPAATAEQASVIVSAENEPSGRVEAVGSHRFVFEQRWEAPLAGLTWRAALRFFLQARAWGLFHSRYATILVRPPAVAPTLIVPPSSRQPAPASKAPAAPGQP